MSAAPMVVAGLSSTPVKGLRVIARDELALEPTGAVDDRRFYVIDDHGRMVNGKRVGALNQVVPEYRAAERILTLSFPDGTAATGPVELGPVMSTNFHSRPAQARPLLGPWSQALSEHAGQPLRVVESEGRAGVDRGRAGAVSLIGRASLDALAEVAGVPSIDQRRFRMTIELAGPEAHAEDAWVRRRLRVGEAVLRVHGHVGRCIITSREPESGKVDLPTLDLLRSYRGDFAATEPLPFGIYAEVAEPGTVRVGDSVELC